MLSDLLLLAPAAIVFAILLLLSLRDRAVVDVAQPEDRTPEEGPPSNAIVVDGSNVMYWGGEPSALILSQVLRAIENKGYAPIVFYDANVGYVLGDRYYDELKMASVTGVAKENICVVDKGVVADQAILAFSKDHKLRIVSNDRYRDWRGQFPHVKRKGRLVRGTCKSGAVKLPAL